VENVTAECPRQFHIDLGVGTKERARSRGSYIVIGPCAVIDHPLTTAVGGLISWLIFIYIGDFNNNEDKVFTFATGTAVTVYSSDGSHSQKWLYDSQQILCSLGTRRLITRSQIKGSVAREGDMRLASLSVAEENVCAYLKCEIYRYLSKLIFPFSLNDR